jgi:hypothetical protein
MSRDKPYVCFIIYFIIIISCYFYTELLQLYLKHAMFLGYIMLQLFCSYSVCYI